MENKNEKGFNVKIYGIDYFLIFKEDGLYFKKKNDKEGDFFIPFEEINYWDGICLNDKFFFKFRFKTLFRIYLILGALFLIISPKPGFAILGIYLFFFLIVAGMFYIKTNYVTLFADFEKIPVRLGSNKKVCYLLKVIRQNCKKLSFKEKITFGTKLKIKQMKNLKQDFQKELKQTEQETKKEQNEQ